MIAELNKTVAMLHSSIAGISSKLDAVIKPRQVTPAKRFSASSSFSSSSCIPSTSSSSSSNASFSSSQLSSDDVKEENDGCHFVSVILL